MARANAAYYARYDPFADFTTAPEIGQVFGELLGAWAAVVWTQLGRPDPLLLVEAGPGRGTMLRDARRAASGMAGFAAAVRLHLIETSPALRQAQAARLAGAVWHDDLAGVPMGPAIVLANEFLDALPIRQFVRRNEGWMERFVADGAFVELPAPVSLGPAPDGSVVERGAAALAWVAGLGARLREMFEIVLAHEGRSAHAIFGTPDDLKFRSSMTLFAQVAPTNAIFQQALDAHFHSQPDNLTLNILRTLK